MREQYNNLLSTLAEADKIGRLGRYGTDISVKPKYRPVYRSISIQFIADVA